MLFIIKQTIRRPSNASFSMVLWNKIIFQRIQIWQHVCNKGIQKYLPVDVYAFYFDAEIRIIQHPLSVVIYIGSFRVLIPIT